MSGEATRAPDGSICPGIVGNNVRMDYLAFFLSRGQDQIVIDQTALSGRWDIRLQYPPGRGSRGGRSGW